ncbi:hypothetical protein R6Q59_020603 [Mikania micrantha]
MEDDSFCFTPCRRDANCTCKICQASINATLDLLPVSAQRTTITKISSSKPSPPETPIFFNPCTVSTPKSDSPRLTPVNSTIRTDLQVEEQEEEDIWFNDDEMCCGSVLEFDGEIRAFICRFYTHENQIVPRNSQELSVLEASSKIPNWEIVQDGLILRSRCQLYKSEMEEVSIWGWPLQTSGLLTTEFDSRSFTILSGRVTEWSNGELSGLIRNANTSWEQRKRSASVWRLDENTWILEYKRSFVFENTRPFSSAMEFLKYKMMRSFQWMKQPCECSNANRLAPT